MSLGENIKNLRVASGLTQKTFAEKMQTTQQRVSEWECDRIEPSLYNVIKMLKVLDVTFEELTEGLDQRH